jgi:uncharacterized protein (DUF1697 family)
MTTFVVLLRGVNVGTHNRIAMADVRAALERGGLAKVSTYLQSGNVIVEDPRRTVAPIEASIEEILNRDLPLKSVVAIARRAADLDAIVHAHPLADRTAGPKALHVGFLKQRAKMRAAVDFTPDRAELHGTEIYLRYAEGQGRSKMTGAALERALGVPLTVRGWNVVTKLRDLTAP